MLSRAVYYIFVDLYTKRHCIKIYYIYRYISHVVVLLRCGETYTTAIDAIEIYTTENYTSQTNSRFTVVRFGLLLRATFSICSP